MTLLKFLQDREKQLKSRLLSIENYLVFTRTFRGKKHYNKGDVEKVKRLIEENKSAIEAVKFFNKKD